MNNDLEIHWFASVVFATILYGIQNFLYKVAAQKNISSSHILNYSSLTVSILSLLSIIITNSSFDNLTWLIIYAIINSSCFAIGTLSKMNALKIMPSSYVFPITRMHSIVAILLAVIFLSDRPTMLEWSGILLAIFMGNLIRIDAKKNVFATSFNFKKGFLFSLITVIATGLSVFTGKLASLNVAKLNYIFISYSAVFFYTLLINKSKINIRILKKQSTWLLGVVIGLLNFCGYYLVLMAFESGPLSVSQGIMSTSFLIPIILSAVIYKEQITPRRLIIILLGFIAILLMSVKV